MAQEKKAQKKLHVKKGDQVRVIAGRSKGLEGKIIQVFPNDEKVIVEGVNRVKKHTKVQQAQRGGTTGGIVTQEAPIHVSNVALLVEVEKDGKKQKVTTRVGYNRVEVQKRRPDGSTAVTELITMGGMAIGAFPGMDYDCASIAILPGDRLLIRDDHVIVHMLEGLGATLRKVSAPFDPEGGAYGEHNYHQGHHHHHHGDHDHHHDHDHDHEHCDHHHH